jgi:hypothetical protein
VKESLFLAIAPCGHARWASPDNDPEEPWDAALAGEILTQLRQGCNIVRVSRDEFLTKYLPQFPCNCDLCPMRFRDLEPKV